MVGDLRDLPHSKIGPLKRRRVVEDPQYRASKVTAGLNESGSQINQHLQAVADNFDMRIFGSPPPNTTELLGSNH